MQLPLQAYRQHRFAILFYSLLLTIAAAPVADLLGLQLLQGFLVLNLLAAALGAASGRLAAVLLGLTGVYAAMGVAGLFWAGILFREIGQAVWALISVITLLGTLRHALRPGAVDRERIYAALTVYVLAGVTFSVVYLLIEQRWPASFAMASGTAFAFPQASYFSFVTLASLGYGDIVPVNDAARALAVLEVIAGQMYLTVLVARLVSLYVSQEHGAPSS
jgi:hypothetical protein